MRLFFSFISRIRFLIIFPILTITVFINTSCDKEVSRSPVEPEPSAGKIVINSEPANSLIFLNNRNTGRYTPDSLTFLSDGEYIITLKRKFYKDTSLTATITEESRTELFIDYTVNPSMYGSLAFFSSPQGGAITLNDSLLNLVTPDTITGLKPGEYSVKIKLFNHRDATLNAVVQSNTLTSYSSVLRDTSVWVDYQLNNSGIQSSQLTCIANDVHNVKWIGSLDKGLIKFDNNGFTNYNKTNSGIPGNLVKCIEVSDDGNVWVGTTEGLAVFNGNTWIIYNRFNSGLTSDLINSVEIDPNGIAWIGSSSGLYRFDGVNWTLYNDSQLRLWVNCTKIDGSRIWIGTNNDGIMSLENGIISYYPDTTFQYLSKKITAIDIDQSGNIWFSHSPDSVQRSGVSYFDGSNFTSFQFSSSNVAVNGLFIDDSNNKWVSTFNGLLKYNSSNSTVLFSTLNSLISSNRCTGSVVDNEGLVWITTSGGGLNKLKVF